MAISGGSVVHVTDYDRLVFSWSRTSVNEGNNTSTISWELKLTSTAYGAISSSVLKDWSVTIDGIVRSGKNSIAIGNNETRVLASGTTTIAHNYDGTKTFTYKFSQQFGITFAGASIGTISKEASVTLDTLRRPAEIISASSFDDEVVNPFFTYSLPSQEIKQLLCNVSWGGVAYISNRDVPTNGKAYTFTLTNEERDTLREAMKNTNSMTVTYTLITVFKDGTTLLSAKDATAKIILANPVIQSTTTILDDENDDDTTELTGNPNVLILGHSRAKVTTFATAYKYATITSIVWKNGTKTKTGANVEFPNVESGTFVCEVTDSRGNKATQTFYKEVIEYAAPTLHLDDLVVSAEGTVSFRAYGTFSNISFGEVLNWLNLTCRLVEEGNAGGTLVPLSPIISGNNYSITMTFTEVDYQKRYTLEVYASDALSVDRQLRDIVVRPVFDWGKDDFKFNVPVHFGAGAFLGGNSIEAGSWTPSLYASAVTSYEVKQGWYQKVGNVVTIGWQIKAAIKSGYDTIGLSISGMPFAPSIPAFGGGVAHNIFIGANLCFEGWAIATTGLINARLQPCNNTAAGNLNIASVACYPTGGGTVTVAGTICFLTND